MAKTDDQQKRRKRALLGRYRPGISVQFYGGFEDYGSFPTVCTQFGRILPRRLEGVALHNYADGPFADPSLEKHAFVDNTAPVGIYYGFPEEIPEAFYQHPFRIGGFVCETDRIADAWVEVCNTFNLVIVPSAFCQKSFYDSGVRCPVMVVPHGIEPEYRPYREKHRSTPFVFYNAFNAASGLQRKSAEELIRCFLRAFGTEGERCILRLRTGLCQSLVDIRLRYDFGTAIQLDLSPAWSTASFAAIFSDVHCTVHPSKGEGFGMIPLQSIACETPVIVPDTTGMSDYVRDWNAVRLRTDGRTHGLMHGNQVGTYFTIDEVHLTELLLAVHETWEDEYRKVQAAGPRIRAIYTWENVLAEFVEVLETILDSDDQSALSCDLRDRFGPRSR